MMTIPTGVGQVQEHETGALLYKEELPGLAVDNLVVMTVEAYTRRSYSVDIDQQWFL
jgi:hypothetical protein